jgi:hypothetical protein
MGRDMTDNSIFQPEVPKSERLNFYTSVWLSYFSIFGMVAWAAYGERLILAGALISFFMSQTILIGLLIRLWMSQFGNTDD